MYPNFINKITFTGREINYFFYYTKRILNKIDLKIKRKLSLFGFFNFIPLRYVKSFIISIIFSFHFVFLYLCGKSSILAFFFHLFFQNFSFPIFVHVFFKFPFLLDIWKKARTFFPLKSSLNNLFSSTCFKTFPNKMFALLTFDKNYKKKIK